MRNLPVTFPWNSWEREEQHEFSDCISNSICGGLRCGTPAQWEVGEGCQHPVLDDLGTSICLGLGGVGHHGQLLSRPPNLGSPWFHVSVDTFQACSFSMFCLSFTKSVLICDPQSSFLPLDPHWGDRDHVARATQATCCIWLFPKMEVNHRLCMMKRKITYLSSSLGSKEFFQRGPATELVPCFPWVPKDITAGAVVNRVDLEAFLWIPEHVSVGRDWLTEQCHPRSCQRS